MGDSWPSAQAARAASRRKTSERRFIFFFGFRVFGESFFFSNSGVREKSILPD